MGMWTLMSARPDIRPRNDVYGHYFAVKFKLKYSPSLMGSFAEMPRLEWKETITMIESRAGTWWQHVVDQYARDPNSQTFISWVSRYSWAHDAVRQQKYGPDDMVSFYDKNGNRLKRDDFPRIESSKEQADFVRNYLKKHGGIMEVLVVDKPGINKPTDTTTHKRRILTFDCGLRGAGIRVAAYQDLTVDGAQPETNWKRECVLQSISQPYSTMGLNKVQAPADVLVVKPFTGSAASGIYL